MSNENINSKGVSVKFLSELLERILNNSEARGINLVTLKRDTVYDGKTFPRGTTIKQKSQYAREGTTPFLGSIKYNQRDVLPKRRSDWTLDDVFEYVVKPTVKEKGTFFIDFIDNKNRVGKEFEGAFLCNARKNSFASLVDSLILYFGARNIQKSFVWIDIFCVRHPLSTEDRNELLESGLEMLISKYSERLIFFQSWIKPITLEDSWCVWEIYCATRDKDSLFEIILPTEEQELFVDTLISDYDSIVENVKKINAEQARCVDPAEEEHIRELIVQKNPTTGGFEHINEVIKEKIWQWLSDTAVTACQTLLDSLHAMYSKAKREAKKVEAGELKMTPQQKSEEKKERARATRQVIELLGYTGKLLIEIGRFEEAKNYLKEALKLSKKFYGEKSDDFALRLNNLGALYSLLGKLDSALDFYVESLNIRKKLHGKKHASLAVCLNNISLLLSQKGRFSDAITCQKKALSIDKTAHGSRHIEVGTDLLNLGNLYSEIGKYEKALKILNESLEIHVEVYGEEHPFVATVYNNIAGVYSDKKDIQQAIQFQKKALAIDKKVYGETNIEVSTDLSNLATYLSMMKKYQNVDKTKEALRYFFQALEIKRNIFGRDHASVATLLNNLAHVYKDIGDLETAQKHGKEAVEILEKVLGSQHPHTIQARQAWGSEDQLKNKNLSRLKREKVIPKTLSRRVMINQDAEEMVRRFSKQGEDPRAAVQGGLKKTESALILGEVRKIKTVREQPILKEEPNENKRQSARYTSENIAKELRMGSDPNLEFDEATQSQLARKRNIPDEKRLVGQLAVKAGVFSEQKVEEMYQEFTSAEGAPPVPSNENN
eukprot:augustus_masked-scaffold_3-processed-gene-15.16-mRNA-1 protein AED:0.11 eAED:0.12 QI:0/-1/0/1/-1/1/1/0/831